MPASTVSRRLILCVNHALRGVELPAGRAEIVFRISARQPSLGAAPGGGGDRTHADLTRLERKVRAPRRTCDSRKRPTYAVVSWIGQSVTVWCIEPRRFR